jgi:hypothetical protein
MKIKAYSATWPPLITIGPFGNQLGAELSDTVLRVRAYDQKIGNIVLSVLDKNGIEYGVPLSFPENISATAILVIAEKLPLTLAQVGELDI